MDAAPGEARVDLLDSDLAELGLDFPRVESHFVKASARLDGWCGAGFRLGAPRSPKSELRTVNGELIRSELGIRNSFGPRISAFGFRSWRSRRGYQSATQRNLHQGIAGKQVRAAKEERVNRVGSGFGGFPILGLLLFA